jgi:hypothetical protein
MLEWLRIPFGIYLMGSGFFGFYLILTTWKDRNALKAALSGLLWPWEVAKILRNIWRK